MFEKIKNYVTGKNSITAYIFSILITTVAIIATMNIGFGTSIISEIFIVLTFVAEALALMHMISGLVCYIVRKLIIKRNYNKIQQILFAVKHSKDEYTGKYLCSDVIDIPYKGIRKDNTIYFTANSEVLIISKGEDTASEYDVCKVNHYLMQKNGYI